MSAHTPGPWHLRISDNGTPHIEHGDCMRYEVGDLINRICVMPAEITMTFNSLNNARLIAAAPDMLAALQHVYNNISNDVPHGVDMGILHAAVAKALAGAA